MTPFERHLQAAQGFLDLGLPLDAHEELEEIEPELRHFSEVLALKVPIFQALEKWALMEVVAKDCASANPRSLAGCSPGRCHSAGRLVARGDAGAGTGRHAFSRGGDPPSIGSPATRLNWDTLKPPGADWRRRTA